MRTIEPGATIYEMMGGERALQDLVNLFYDKVAADSTLRPLFPDDFTEIRNKQYMFLTQFFGGPPLFSETHGAPMMRARHLKVPIQEKHVQAWLACMASSLREIGVHGALFDFVIDRLTKTAYHMMNLTEDGQPYPPRTVHIEIDSSESNAKE